MLTEEERKEFQELEQTNKKLTTAKAAVALELANLKPKLVAAERELERIKTIASTLLVAMSSFKQTALQLHALAEDPEITAEQWVPEAMAFVEELATQFATADKQLEKPPETKQESQAKEELQAP